MNVTSSSPKRREPVREETPQQRFLALAAHELKTPLTTILGAAELLMEGAEQDPDARRRFLGYILTEAERAQRLAETLLHLARTGHDQREPKLAATDLVGVAREAVFRMEPLARGAGMELRVEGERAFANADHEWLTSGQEGGHAR